ncbi:MAG: glycosyltransferase family 2 protein [Alphaproteobacteria bacterium]|nr:glycosyltransferase family 2 protein [Alphaproteobacteria bacterium]
MIVSIAEDLILAWFPTAPSVTRVSRALLRAGGQPLHPPYAMFADATLDDPSSGIVLLARRSAETDELSLVENGVEHLAAPSDASSTLSELARRLSPSARANVLLELLTTVPAHFRENSQALSNAIGQLLDASGIAKPAVAGAYAIGDAETLVRLVPPTGTAADGGYRITSDGVRRERGPVDDDGAEQHWILGSIVQGGSVPDRLVGFAGGGVWHIRLDAIRPKPAAALFGYLETLKPGSAMRFVRGLRRWDAAMERSAKVRALIEDCVIFFGGGTRNAEGRSVKPFAYGIEAADPIPGGGVLVRGWLFDPHDRLDRIEAVDATDARFPLPRLWPTLHQDASERWKRAGLPVPERAGFVAFVDGGVPGPWGVDIVLKSGARIATSVPPADPDPRRARDAILTALPASAEIDGALTEAIAPAVERLHAEHMSRYPVDARSRPLIRIGQPPLNPRASVVIPLYRNLNFLGFQQAAFARDTAFADVEIVYVLDSPEQVGFLEGLLRGEHLIYGLPVTVVVHPVNLGFAAAANSGARVARGRDLVLMNSDVVPETSGWLEPLLAALDRPGVGAAAPQLLYFDDSLQFAGMYFERDADGCWFNRHIAKGYPRTYPPANKPREVPALTGACLSIRRQLYERMGGFDEAFVIGDFEDSEFSLRLRDAGLSCWYEPSAALYHVERQSIEQHAAHGKSVATMVNRWRQQRLWDEAIGMLMADAGNRWGLPPTLMPEIERLT